MLIQLTRCLGFLLLMLLPSLGHAYRTPAHTKLPLQEKLEIIDERFSFYKNSFPSIQFAYLAGGEQWREDYIALITLLGQSPVSLDYEHPPELAADIISVTLQRILLMLQQDIVSESLFQTDKQGPLKGKSLCVLTLNPVTYVDDNMKTTAYMVDLPEALMLKIHPSRLLDPRDHLRFTIDHEIFHCLESKLLGGAPMTHQEYGGEYNLFRRESAADVFALVQHRQQRDTTPRYAENIVLLRALWLFSEGPNRSTYESMLEVYRRPPGAFKGKTAMEAFRLAIEIRDRVTGSYEFYVGQRAAAVKAAKKLGYSPHNYGDAWVSLENLQADTQRVNYKIERYRYYYDRLFDDTTVKFLPADPPEFYD